jgi:hypothetical protein
MIDIIASTRLTARQFCMAQLVVAKSAAREPNAGYFALPVWTVRGSRKPG